ncbi:MAG: SDR family oxidoreductase [Candidatus Omnitrophica bacterium]|nr:SDR family oxidoreductase [Candidatus Omnitrophota bacterium]
MITDQGGIFLTGVTGTLGQEMLRTLLEGPGLQPIYVLARDSRKLSAEERVQKLLETSTASRESRGRLNILKGDVTDPNFGLSDADIAKLSRDVRRMFHVAALTSLNGTQEDCERINLGGTRHALELARYLKTQGHLQRFFYFSTAYAAGSRQKYHSYENELPQKPVFANFYESSKYQAETLVRAALVSDLQGMIFRPSIVVGHSQTGAVSQFNVIYPFIRLFAHGMLKMLPSRPENSFNIVPIDFVVEAALRISEHDEFLGKVFHLVTPEPPTIQMLLQLKVEDYPDFGEVEIVDPDQFSRSSLAEDQQFIFDMLGPYLGYLNDALTFDTANTAAALKTIGLTFPKTGLPFLRTLIRYAVDQGYLVPKV